TTVFQMTSTVRAELRDETTLPALLRATFPCGSITGAPKHHTMQLIDALESTRRGLYCGAIGWLDAPSGDARCGNFCLSVAIRTLTLGAERQGLWPAVLGVGAGIVLDSVADDEFEECRLKSRFLTSIEPGFELFETMLALPGRGVQHRDRHLDRLQHSAAVLGFDFERAQAEAVLHEAVNNAVLDAGGPRRIRLALSHDGRITSSQGPLPLLPRGEVGLLIAAQRLPEHRPLAAHKTTARSHYDAGVRDAEQAGAFDSLFFTADGRLVEGGRSTVCLRIDGHWFTPPVDDGALPGIMRSLLLEDPAWQLGTRSLGLDDLQRAEAMVVCNALRGVLPAHLVVRPGR
ncbi:MAG: aminotransferase class IV, partial [Rhizobacter sp.]|nr:aminotransferase class IV [Rhizobacter sp.]